MDDSKSFSLSVQLAVVWQLQPKETVLSQPVAVNTITTVGYTYRSKTVDITLHIFKESLHSLMPVRYELHFFYNVHLQQMLPVGICKIFMDIWYYVLYIRYLITHVGEVDH